MKRNAKNTRKSRIIELDDANLNEVAGGGRRGRHRCASQQPYVVVPQAPYAYPQPAYAPAPFIPPAGPVYAAPATPYTVAPAYGRVASTVRLGTAR